MRAGLSLVFLLPLVLLSGCGGDDVAVPYERAAGFDALGEAGAQALAAFEKACPVVKREVGDLEYIKVQPALGYPKTPDYGWNRAVSVEFKVKDQPTGVGLGLIAGTECTFDMGGGFRPGLHVMRSDCAEVCGMAKGFTAEPKLAVLESKEEADAAERKRLSEGAAALAELEKKALAGDYQAQRNLAYSLAIGADGAPYEPVKACAWRAVIIASASSKVSDGDHRNVQQNCGKLDDEGRQQAQVLAEQILTRVRGG